MTLADWLIRHLFIPGMGLWALLMIAREFGAFPSRRRNPTPTGGRDGGVSPESQTSAYRPEVGS